MSVTGSSSVKGACSFRLLASISRKTSLKRVDGFNRHSPLFLPGE